ncbi:DUF742 domain-containing protein [Streptomyces sp. NBC_01497]|uniref:DUF742 domain-containing protein n=1 Tax=Streptomyces sp. NBC_01497 TaxID=2903885 RepID=UPI002E3517AC|nr:DUF742 domain-containing protein [Streptomyces sp. NBC_01497]
MATPPDGYPHEGTRRYPDAPGPQHSGPGAAAAGGYPDGGSYQGAHPGSARHGAPQQGGPRHGGPYPGPYPGVHPSGAQPGGTYQGGPGGPYPGGQGGRQGGPSGPQGGRNDPYQGVQQPQGPFERPRIQPIAPRRAPEPTREPMGPHNPLVRPYAMTGGRTRPRYQLAMEALVSTTAELSSLHGQLPEHQRICRLCIEVKSVAEISALLSIPLGVTRILVADLAEAGLVAIHQPGGDESAGGQPDVTLLERVLSGLRKL